MGLRKDFSEGLSQEYENGMKFELDSWLAKRDECGMKLEEDQRTAAKDADIVQKLDASSQFSPEERAAIYRHLGRYVKPEWKTPILQQLVLALMYIAAFWTRGPIRVLLCIVIKLSMFGTMHDMAHNNYFPYKPLNNILGRFYGACISWSFQSWKQDHNQHHKDSGDLDGSLAQLSSPWTVSHFRSADWSTRIVYTLKWGWMTYPLGRAIEIVVTSTRTADLTDKLVYAILWAIILRFRMYEEVISSVLMWAIFGTLLIEHSTHTFEHSYREHIGNWSKFDAAMLGSLRLKDTLFNTLIAGNAGTFHFIHHLNSKIPVYRLGDVVRDNPALFAKVPEHGLRELLASATYSLYDDEAKKFVSVYSVLLNMLIT